MYSRSSYEFDKLIDKLIYILEPIYLWIEQWYIQKSIYIKKNKK